MFLAAVILALLNPIADEPLPKRPHITPPPPGYVNLADPERPLPDPDRCTRDEAFRALKAIAVTVEARAGGIEVLSDDLSEGDKQITLAQRRLDLLKTEAEALRTAQELLDRCYTDFVLVPIVAPMDEATAKGWKTLEAK